MASILPLRIEEQEAMADFTKKILVPNRDLWILRWSTLAAQHLRIPKPLRQLVQLPDRMVPQVIESLSKMRLNSIYQRYGYLGWQISHADESFELTMTLVGLQMTSLLDVSDQLLFSPKQGNGKHKQKGSNGKNDFQQVWTSFSKFQHNCRLSFVDAFFENERVKEQIYRNGMTRALEKSESRSREESFLREILRGTSQYLNFNDLFRIFSRSLRQMGAYDRVSVALKTDVEGEAELVCLDTEEANAVPQGMLFQNDCSMIPAMSEKKSRVVQDFARNVSCEICAGLSKSGMRSAVIAPLVIGNEVLGTLNVESKSPSFFKESEIPFFEKMAGGLAVAVRNSREHSKLIEKLHNEQCARDMISKIHSSLNLNDVMNTVCRELSHCTGADRVLLAEVMEPKSMVRVVSEFVNPDSAVETMPSMMGSYPMDTFRDISALLRKGETIAAHLTASAVPEPFKASLEFLRARKIKTICLVPIFIFDKYWGAVAIHHCRQTYRWKKIQMDLLKNIAKEISAAIEKARIYQKEKETVLRLQELVKSKSGNDA